MLTEKQKQWLLATHQAKYLLKKGDRVRLTHCPGTKRTITFDSWDGNWIVSKSGKNDYSAASIDRVNGKPINFNVGRYKRPSKKREWKSFQDFPRSINHNDVDDDLPF